MKKLLMTIKAVLLITIIINPVTDERDQDDEIRRPFTPGREQNIF